MLKCDKFVGKVHSTTYKVVKAHREKQTKN